MKTLLERTQLEYCKGSSDKVYIADVVHTGIHYLVECFYGRNGASLTVAEKYRGVSRYEATTAYEKVVKEKRSKGYTDFRGGIIGLPESAASSASRSSETETFKPTLQSTPVIRVDLSEKFLPMLATALTEEDTFTLMVKDKSFAFQRKYDGVRCVVEAILPERGDLCIFGYNRKGQKLDLPANVVSFFKRFVFPLTRTDENGEDVPMFTREESYFFDGELMGDTYRIFDCMQIDGANTMSSPFTHRYSDLAEIFFKQEGNAANLLIAPTAFTQNQKEKMIKEAREDQWEGIIVRKTTGAYEAGTRSKDVLKFKFWDSATCKVLAKNDKRSIQLGMLQYGTLVNVGSCTVPVNQIIPEIDSLVEIRYLYAHDGGSLFQPTLIGVRHDKDLPDDRTSLRMTPPEKRGVALV